MPRPYSMIDREHAVHTQYNNVVGTLNVLYAIKEVDPESISSSSGRWANTARRTSTSRKGGSTSRTRAAPTACSTRSGPGSFYHLCKVHDSHNIEFACRVWGLRATDLNQGVVYGQQTPQTALDDRLATRFDYDAIFGTVLNRFVVQAVLGEPLTVYGEGGQTRGVIDIRDTVECLRLTSEQPAERGEFRVFNQMTESFTVNESPRWWPTSYPGEVSIENIENPRVEAETHYYNVVHSGLVELGLTPHSLSETLISSMFDVAERYKDRVDRDALLPLVNWRRTANRVRPS